MACGQGHPVTISIKTGRPPGGVTLFPHLRSAFASRCSPCSLLARCESSSPQPCSEQLLLQQSSEETNVHNRKKAGSSPKRNPVLWATEGGSSGHTEAGRQEGKPRRNGRPGRRAGDERGGEGEETDGNLITGAFGFCTGGPNFVEEFR